MIPILYTKDETAFASNGLGRLVECIRCEVTEERNGIYECEFDYPISGRFCNEMMENGGVISVTHDDNGDKQAFDIYGYSAPIDGVVTFNAHHISYRLNGVIVTPFNANSCAAALQGIKTHSANNNPFTFSTDKTASGPYTVATPSNARGLLAGNAGSVLDIYGTGEYKFDMFNVGLFLHRGRNTDVQIRYGKNLTDITSTLDKSATFNAIAPYWTNGEETVTLPEVYIALSGETDIYCVPVDLTADFENKPTVGELRADANRYLSTINPNVPDENITIDFAALWQTTDYEDVAALERVGLCDTVSIYFEALGVTQAQAKIIKVVYDVLRERYISMEFGKVQTTLAEAILGTSASGLQDLSAGQVIGASIITAALIKAATSRFAEVYIGGDGYTPGIIYLQDQYDELKGTIGNSGLSFESGGQDFAAFSANSKKLNFEFAPQDDGTLYPSKNILSLETIEDNYSEEWDAFEQAYGEIQVARVKVNNGAATQADKIIINSKNGARIELYDASGTGLLTQVVPRIFKQLFPNGNTAVELGNDANGSHLKLNDPNGYTVINLDTQNGSTFGNGVSVTGGTNTDTLSASGNATVGGDLTVTGDVSADDVTVGGVLDVAKRRCYATVSTAAWYRVFDYNAANEARVSGDIAFLIDITILEWARQSHKITLYGLLGALKFGDEVSVTGTSFVDKIRYVKSGNHGYIDIHYSSSVSRYIACYYDVKCVYVDNLNRFSATTPTMVGDSPSGETVLTEHTFVSNNTGDKIDFTPTSGTSYSNYGGCWYARTGNIVQVHVGISGLTANTNTTIFSIPGVFRPKSTVVSTGKAASNLTYSQLQVGENGNVQVVSSGTYAICDITYIV
jgi:phage minor structural protein